ncbi:regulated-snare-like domain-containing protein [Calycina marina]|uniref:Protein transport protein SEC22 n=1 Tax=Calycina marina TaxID=1763456 RepID=A0A9P7Z1C8_9HELO|nr:regulated-snare-like domain-containing protein [Calycina marina]
MIRSTQIARLDGLMLCASVDDEQTESSLAEIKSQVNMVLRRLNRNSEQQASIESSVYTLQYVTEDYTKRFVAKGGSRSKEASFQCFKKSETWEDFYMIFQEIIYLCISEKSYPRKLAFTFLSDISNEFSTTYASTHLLSPSLRPYAFMEFDTFIARTKSTYSDTRATQNLGKLNDELRDVTKVMTKNIEDLLYRGDSLERMGEVSSRLREDSLKYRKAAVRINWELLLKQYGPLGGLGLFIIIFLWWRFF